MNEGPLKSKNWIVTKLKAMKLMCLQVAGESWGLNDLVKTWRNSIFILEVCFILQAGTHSPLMVFRRSWIPLVSSESPLLFEDNSQYNVFLYRDQPNLVASLHWFGSWFGLLRFKFLKWESSDTLSGHLGTNIWIPARNRVERCDHWWRTSQVEELDCH